MSNRQLLQVGCRRGYKDGEGLHDTENVIYAASMGVGTQRADCGSNMSMVEAV